MNQMLDESIQKQMQQLVESALEARKFSYSPYSHFQVGAALLCKDGTVYTGCNIENAAFGPTNCAERTAFFKAVSEGKRDFVAIAIAGGPAGEEILDYAYPCGVCRQVMREFCDPQTFMLYFNDKGNIVTMTLAEMLPLGFGPSNLKSGT